MLFSWSTASLSRGLRLGLGLLMLTWLAACGGGGGGGGDTAVGMQIRFDRNTISLTAEENPQPGQGGQVIEASATGGDGNESLFIGAEQQGVGLVLPIDVTLDTTARTARITLMPNATLAPGTYTGTVRLLACKDALCAAHHGGSPFTVSYTTVITPCLPTRSQGRPSTRASNCARVSSRLAPIGTRAKLPWFKRRAASQTPIPSCTSTFMRSPRLFRNT